MDWFELFGKAPLLARRNNNNNKKNEPAYDTPPAGFDDSNTPEKGFDSSNRPERGFDSSNRPEKGFDNSRPEGSRPEGSRPEGSRPEGGFDSSRPEANRPDAFMQWDSLHVKLPTQQRIKEILLKMQTFDLKKALPQRLDYTPTTADAELQKNVLALFPTTTPGEKHAAQGDDRLEAIAGGLLSIVAKTDEFMTESQKRQADSRSSSLPADQKRQLVLLYPCLMALIKALLIHCQNMTMQMQETEKGQDSSIHKCVLDTWQQIMGELHDIHTVILFAARKQLLELGDFPMEWMQTMQNMNSEISNLRNIILGLNDSLNHEQALLNERDKQLQQIMNRYAEVETRVQLIKVQKNNIFATLNSYTYIPNIVHVNLQRVALAYPPAH